MQTNVKLIRKETIADGTIVTPVRSMVAQATHDKTTHQITLLHASRTPADLPLKSDFERLARENPNFSYVMTAQSTPEKWLGEHGRVNAAMLKKVRAGSAQAYLLPVRSAGHGQGHASPAGGSQGQ
jgi:NAD(P)H-flavin reductase